MRGERHPSDTQKRTKLYHDDFNFVLFSFHFQFVWKEKIGRRRRKEVFIPPRMICRPECGKIGSRFPFLSKSSMNLSVPNFFYWFMVTRRPLARFLSLLTLCTHENFSHLFSQHNKLWQSRAWTKRRKRKMKNLSLFINERCAHFLLPCHLWRLRSDSWMKFLLNEGVSIKGKRLFKKSCLHNIKHQAVESVP